MDLDSEFIDPEATDLVPVRESHYSTEYECGCYTYFGDLDAPHDRPCRRHAVVFD